MKAGKISEASFDINLTPGESTSVRLQLRNGELCLSISGVLLSGKGLWYELPLRDIKRVDIVEDGEVKLRFVMEDLEVTIKGNNPYHLRALRHLLLPFIESSTT